MQKEEGLTPAEQELESALGQLKPAANTLNRDELMFNAGRAAAGNKQFWQMLSGMLMVLLLCSVLIRSDIYRPRKSPSSYDRGQLQMVQAMHRPVLTELAGAWTGFFAAQARYEQRCSAQESETVVGEHVVVIVFDQLQRAAVRILTGHV
jgi:hypothetical protein